jgi:hypothetical protein
MPMILSPGKGWPGMAQGRKRGMALAAALTVSTCERARGCPRLLAAPAGPAAERAIDRSTAARPVQAQRGFRRGDPGRPGRPGRLGDNRGGCAGFPPGRGRRPGPPAARCRHNDSLPYQLAIHGRAESAGNPRQLRPASWREGKRRPAAARYAEEGCVMRTTWWG